VTVREQGADVIYRNRDGSRPAVQNYGGPSVNQLVLVNHSKRPLLLLAGELVSGGKQDRVIGKDRIVAAVRRAAAAGGFLCGARALVFRFAIQ